MGVKAEPTFSLKDELFNKQKVSKIAGEIAAVYQEFEQSQFVTTVTKQFPQQELMERLNWIRDCLREFLPEDYRAAVEILTKSLPPPCDPTLSDDDFGDFIYGPYGAFVAEYGCTKKDLVFSLKVLKEFTTRFSVEGPIRPFLNEFPKETLAAMDEWVTDDHYHVRRLVSEGTRPLLPWAKKITIDYREPLRFLDQLHADPTRFVTRSVANHLNDISKTDPDLVVTTLKRWQKAGKQTEKEMAFITKHSLRTLEKQGHASALQLLGFNSGEVKVGKYTLQTPTVTIGEALEFSFTITSTSKTTQNLLVDYHLYFRKAHGTLAPKTFKIAKTAIKPGETLSFHKRQPLRPMTTRTLYPGQHEIELQINGKTYPRKAFVLKSS